MYDVSTLLSMMAPVSPLVLVSSCTSVSSLLCLLCVRGVCAVHVKVGGGYPSLATHCMSLVSPSTSTSLPSSSIPCIDPHSMEAATPTSTYTEAFTVSNSLMSLSRHIQVPWSSLASLSILRLHSLCELN